MTTVEFRYTRFEPRRADALRMPATCRTVRGTVATMRLAAAVALMAACSSPAPGSGVDGGSVGSLDGGNPDATEQSDAAPPEPGAEYIFDDDSLRTYDLTIARVDWDWLNANALMEQYVPAELTFEGKSYGTIGVRYKGGFGTLQGCFDSAGNRQCPKLSMKLKFNEYDNAFRFFGLKKLNFHSMIGDASHLRDRLSYSLYRDMGVDGPRAVHGILRVNGESLGVFAAIEQVDGRFARSRFPDGGEGNVYKEVWPLYSVAQPYIDALKTNENQNPDVTPMQRFAAALTGATDQTVESVLRHWTELDTLMAFLAVDRAIENWDGIVAWYCGGAWCGNHNFYWYQETTRDKMWLIPWDMDNTFQIPTATETWGIPAWDEVASGCDPVPFLTLPDGTVISGRGAYCDPLIGWLGGVLRPQFFAASITLLDGPFAAAAVNAKLDKWEAQIRDAVAADSNGPTTAEWNQAVTQLRTNIITLRRRVETKIGR